MKKMDHGNNTNNESNPSDQIKDDDVTIQLIWKELKTNRKEQKENNVYLLDQIADEKQQLTKIKSDLEVGLNELTKEVAKNIRACEIINKLQNNIVDLKAENVKLISDNIELKESVSFTEYIAKKENLILNGIKDHPNNGGKTENSKRFIPIYI